MTRRMLFLFGFLSLLAPPNSLEAGCTCGGIPYWCLNDIVPMPGSVINWTATTVMVIGGPFNNGPCMPGQNPPKKTCAANAGIVNVKSWEITGTVEYEIFNVSAKYGADTTVNASCAGSQVEISSWCQCCHTYAGIEWDYTYAEGNCICSNIFGDWCSVVIGGTNKHNPVAKCGEYTCTVPQPCNAVCGGG